jgi:hypothetical protein
MDGPYLTEDVRGGITKNGSPRTPALSSISSIPSTSISLVPAAKYDEPIQESITETHRNKALAIETPAVLYQESTSDSPTRGSSFGKNGSIGEPNIDPPSQLVRPRFSRAFDDEVAEAPADVVVRDICAIIPDVRSDTQGVKVALPIIYDIQNSRTPPTITAVPDPVTPPSTSTIPIPATPPATTAPAPPHQAPQLPLPQPKIILRFSNPKTTIQKTPKPTPAPSQAIRTSRQSSITRINKIQVEVERSIRPIPIPELPLTPCSLVRDISPVTLSPAGKGADDIAQNRGEYEGDESGSNALRMELRGLNRLMRGLEDDRIPESGEMRVSMERGSGNLPILSDDEKEKQKETEEEVRRGILRELGITGGLDLGMDLEDRLFERVMARMHPARRGITEPGTAIVGGEYKGVESEWMVHWNVIIH